MLRFSSYTTCGFPTAVSILCLCSLCLVLDIRFFSGPVYLVFYILLVSMRVYFPSFFCGVGYFYDPVDDLVYVIDWFSLLHMIWKLVLLMETTIPPCSRCVFFMCVLSGLMPSLHFSVLILHLWLNPFPLKDLPLNFLVGLLTFAILSLLQLKFSSVLIFLLNLVFKSWIIFIIYFSHMSVYVFLGISQAFVIILFMFNKLYLL